MDLLVEPFRHAFMQRALAEVLLLAVLTGVVSVHVQLRRLAFFGEALTHTVFPGAAIAFVAGGSILVGAGAAGLLSAVAFTALSRRREDLDAVLAVTVGAFFAVGVIVVSSRPSFTSDLTALVFGQILNVDRREIIDTAVVALIVLVGLASLHGILVFSAFDPDGARAAGHRVRLADLVVNAAIAMSVVAAVRAVGTVLVFAFVVVPAATARLVTDRLALLFPISVAIAAVCGYVGLAVSYEMSLRHDLRLASGAAVVVTLTVAFAATALGTGAVRRFATRSRSHTPLSSQTVPVP